MNKLPIDLFRLYHPNLDPTLQLFTLDVLILCKLLYYELITKPIVLSKNDKRYYWYEEDPENRVYKLINFSSTELIEWKKYKNDRRSLKDLVEKNINNEQYRGVKGRISYTHRIFTSIPGIKDEYYIKTFIREQLNNPNLFDEYLSICEKIYKDPYPMDYYYRLGSPKASDYLVDEFLVPLNAFGKSIDVIDESNFTSINDQETSNDNSIIIILDKNENKIKSSTTDKRNELIKKDVHYGSLTNIRQLSGKLCYINTISSYKNDPSCKIYCYHDDTITSYSNYRSIKLNFQTLLENKYRFFYANYSLYYLYTNAILLDEGSKIPLKSENYFNTTIYDFYYNKNDDQYHDERSKLFKWLEEKNVITEQWIEKEFNLDDDEEDEEDEDDRKDQFLEKIHSNTTNDNKNFIEILDDSSSSDDNNAFTTTINKRKDANENNNNNDIFIEIEDESTTSEEFIDTIPTSTELLHSKTISPLKDKLDSQEIPLKRDSFLDDPYDQPTTITTMYSNEPSTSVIVKNKKRNRNYLQKDSYSLSTNYPIKNKIYEDIESIENPPWNKVKRSKYN